MQPSEKYDILDSDEINRGGCACGFCWWRMTVQTAVGLVYALEQEGYAVHHVPDAAGGKLAAEREPFDLAILDLMLPDGSGYDVCRALRANRETPVIFLTACDDEVNVVMGLEMGADDYVTKPFRIRELMARIKNVLRRRGRPDTEAIRLGNIWIYPARRA